MKVFKNIFFIGIILALSLFNYVSGENIMPVGSTLDSDDEDVLIKSFKSTDATFYQSNINFKATILDEYISMESLEEIENNFVNMLGIDVNSSTYSRDVVINSNYRQISIWGEDHKKRSFTVILLSENDEVRKSQGTSIFIDVIQNNNIKDIKELKDSIEKIFWDYNTKTEISTCIIGTFKGQLSSSKKLTKITKALKSIDAKKVEGIFEDSLVSISAYTPNIDNYIYTGYDKMNLNTSIRYNEYEGKTYIWVASPIIPIGY